MRPIVFCPPFALVRKTTNISDIVIIYLTIALNVCDFAFSDIVSAITTDFFKFLNYAFHCSSPLCVYDDFIAVQCIFAPVILIGDIALITKLVAEAFLIKYLMLLSAPAKYSKATFIA